MGGFLFFEQECLEYMQITPWCTIVNQFPVNAIIDTTCYGVLMDRLKLATAFELPNQVNLQASCNAGDPSVGNYSRLEWSSRRACCNQ